MVDVISTKKNGSKQGGEDPFIDGVPSACFGCVHFDNGRCRKLKKAIGTFDYGCRYWDSGKRKRK